MSLLQPTELLSLGLAVAYRREEPFLQGAGLTDIRHRRLEHKPALSDDADIRA